MAHECKNVIWRDEAVRRVYTLRRRTLAECPTGSVGLGTLSGRTLAVDVIADRNLPAWDHATMDDLAFDATDECPLSIVSGEVFSESEPPELDAGKAAEIATGAPLPEGANAVLKREEASVHAGELTGTSILLGTYVCEQGNNVAAGERLSPKDAILLDDLGVDSFGVYAPFSTGVLAIGTEIHEERERDLDSAMLAGLVQSWGHDGTYAGTIPNDYEQVRDRIDSLAAENNVVITTGGTSVGHKDYVVRAPDELGEVLFHRVRVRPSKPIAVAQPPDAVVFAILGKPLGAHIIATLVMRPFFTGDGTTPTVEATLSTDVGLGPDGFEYAVPVLVDGKSAVPMDHADSPLAVYGETFDPSVVSSSTRATRADGLIFTRTQSGEGNTVEVTPYPVVE